MLRARGVKAPTEYPPRNLPPASEWLRSVLSVVETAELLAAVFPPASIEIEPSQKPGDVDIRVHGARTYHLQIKSWTPERIRGRGETLSLDELIRQARVQVLGRFARNSPASSFTKITVHWGKDGRPAFSGLSVTVQSSYGIHVTVVEVDSAILLEMARRKLQRSIELASEQLEPVDAGVLVPVIDLTRYPHNQTDLIKEARRLLSERPAWANIGGVLLVTKRPGQEDSHTGLHFPEARLIGVENPNAPKDRRFDPKVFNPTLDEETIYEERMVVIRVDPPQVDLRIDGRAIIVNGALFGYLPKETSVPYALRPDAVDSSDS